MDTYVKASLVFCIAVSSAAAVHAQEGEYDPCSFTYFDPHCSPSGWMGLMVGDVFIAIILAVIVYYLGKRSDTKLEESTRKIEEIMIQENERRKRLLIFASHTLKNQFSVILMITGLMNQALAKAEKYEDIPAMIQNREYDIAQAVKRADDIIRLIVEIVDPLLIEQIHRFLLEIENIKPRSGVGKGFPKYDYLKNQITHLTQKINSEMEPEGTVLK